MNNWCCSLPFVGPVTWARRNPLLPFHGFWLRGEFSGSYAGLHQPPALLINRIAAYYSSSLPLRFLFSCNLLFLLLTLSPYNL